MRSQLIWCIAVNILAALLSIGVLYLYPAGRGFTVGYGTAHFIQGGTFIAALPDDLCQYCDRRLPRISTFHNIVNAEVTLVRPVLLERVGFRP